MSGENKTRWSLLDFGFLQEMVKAMEFGAKKYSDYGWQSKEFTEKRVENFWNAGIRHMTKYIEGQHEDEESGLSHLAHAACNMMMLYWHEASAERVTL